MTDTTEIQTGLAEVIYDVARVPQDKVVPAASFEHDLDLDSLTMVEVVVACEDRFGVRIPDADVLDLKTVGDAITYIAKAGVAA